MIEILVNNKKIQLESSCSLHDALVRWNYMGGYFAVAINQTIIPESQYVSTFLHDNDCIDILSPMQGG